MEGAALFNDILYDPPSSGYEASHVMPDTDTASQEFPLGNEEAPLAAPRVMYSDTGMQTAPSVNGTKFAAVYGRKSTTFDLATKTGKAGLEYFDGNNFESCPKVRYGVPYVAAAKKTPEPGGMPGPGETPIKKVMYADTGFQTLPAAPVSDTIFDARRQANELVQSYQDVAEQAGVKVWVETEDYFLIHSEQHLITTRPNRNGNVTDRSKDASMLPKIYSTTINSAKDDAVDLTGLPMPMEDYSGATHNSALGSDVSPHTHYSQHKYEAPVSGAVLQPIAVLDSLTIYTNYEPEPIEDYGEWMMIKLVEVPPELIEDYGGIESVLKVDDEEEQYEAPKAVLETIDNVESEPIQEPSVSMGKETIEELTCTGMAKRVPANSVQEQAAPTGIHNVEVRRGKSPPALSSHNYAHDDDEPVITHERIPSRPHSHQRAGKCGTPEAQCRVHRDESPLPTVSRMGCLRVFEIGTPEYSKPHSSRKRKQDDVTIISDMKSAREIENRKRIKRKEEASQQGKSYMQLYHECQQRLQQRRQKQQEAELLQQHAMEEERARNARIREERNNRSRPVGVWTGGDRVKARKANTSRKRQNFKSRQ